MDNSIKLNIQQEEVSFANGINRYKLSWIFMIGSFLGFLVETFWYFTQNGYYVCRKGVIYSPISPIYGIGAVLVTIFLYRIKNKNAVILLHYQVLLDLPLNFYVLCCKRLYLEQEHGTIAIHHLILMVE